LITLFGGAGRRTKVAQVIHASIKRLIRRVFGAFGYAIRDVGCGVGGVELLHDARILMGAVTEPVLFDVGANIGQTTRAMLAAFRSPQIRAFEPSPATFEVLRRAVGNKPGVTVEPLAMGDAQGVLPFHVTQDYSVNDSLLTPIWNERDAVVEVRVETIDTYCHSHGIESISLLKIDAQGYDLHVLKGARRMLDDRRIRLYSCEANFEHMYERQATLRDLLAFADEVGYKLVGFYEQTHFKNRLSYLDALFFTG
jgi:FkbM family methyltransferase